MAVVMHFSGRSILSATVAEIGGTQPVFVNLVGGSSFKIRVSFDVPAMGGVGAMQQVVATGEEAGSLVAAEESACAAARRVLWEDYKYIVLDYSLSRVWCCKERHTGLLEKLQLSKSIFEDVCRRSFEVFSSIESAPGFFAGKIGDLQRSRAEDAVVHAASLCIGFLQMMTVHAGDIRDQVREALDGMMEHADVDDLLNVAGFILPIDDGVRMNISGGTRMMLDRVADTLGYGFPVSRIVTRGDRHKCYFDFPAAGDGGTMELRTFGRVASSVAKATETAIYNSLLAFSVNRGVEIMDPNRNAYLFAKERVREVSSDVELLGNSASAICPYFDSTRRGLNIMSDSFSETLRRHPVGEELAGKLEAFTAEVDQCLTGITEAVRSMNENVVVALLRF